MLKIKF